MSQSSRFLAIVGASGSGKSSVARAGLLAALRAGKLPDSQNWPQIILKPGAKPLESLAVAWCSHAALGRGQDTAELIEKFKRQGYRLHLLSREALHGQPDSRRLVILVDQFEEVFSLCSDKDERKVFIDNLLNAALDITGQTIVILTMRADFYGKCAEYQQLATALSDNHFLLGPMSQAELREAIVAPAQRFGCEVEPALLQRLLADVAGQPGSLPLLEHALERLWEQRHSRKLSLDDYKGLENALEEWANQNYNHLTPEQKALCQRIFLRLVQPGEGVEDTRRRARLEELGGGADADRVIKVLADARLITTQEQVAEVAHEALIRKWSVLRHWVDQDRQALRMQHQLSDAAQQWKDNKLKDKKRRGKDWLLTGSRLLAAQEWLSNHTENASALEKEYVRQSSLRVRRQKQLTWGGTWLAFMALAVFAYDQYVAAKREKARREPEPYVEENWKSFEPDDFIMGSSPAIDKEAEQDEMPAHLVRITKPFKLSRYEVTYKEYEHFAYDTDRRPPGDQGFGDNMSKEDRDRLPVINVSWNDAQAYAKWLSEKTGKKFRLPTEVEWEYAARAGTTDARFWGADSARACKYANVFDIAHEPHLKSRYGTGNIPHACNDEYPFIAPIGHYQPNPFGLYDMIGNVAEWVQDCYHDSYEGAPDNGASWESEDEGNTCNWPVLRGGSFSSLPNAARSTDRTLNESDFREHDTGFRLAQDPD